MRTLHEMCRQPLRSTFGAGLIAALAWACAPTGTPTDAGRDAPIVAPAESCVQPGAEGNEIGVGRFCSPRRGQCATTPLARLCVPDAAPEVTDWYCTRLCDSDADCGTAALCLGDARGMGCVPIACLGTLDAGAADAGALDTGDRPDASASDGGGSDASTFDATAGRDAP